MFAESVHCQIGVAQGNRKVVPRTRTGSCEWSVSEGVVAALYDVVFTWTVYHKNEAIYSRSEVTSLMSLTQHAAMLEVYLI